MCQFSAHCSISGTHSKPTMLHGYRKTLDRIYRSIICFFSPLAALSTIEASFKSKSVTSVFFSRPMGSHQQQTRPRDIGFAQKKSTKFCPSPITARCLASEFLNPSLVPRFRLRIVSTAFGLEHDPLRCGPHIFCTSSLTSQRSRPVPTQTVRRPPKLLPRPIHSTNSQPSWISSRKFLS